MAEGRLLITGAGVRRLDSQRPDDDADALVVEGDRIAWIGSRDAAPSVERRIDYDGWLTPAFVDAHVHATATGLAAEGISLAGCASLAEALVRLRAYAATSTLDPILGGQWDETDWPEQRPPHAVEIAEAAPGRTVLLERIDSHSCVVDMRTFQDLRAAGLRDVEATHPDTVVRDYHGEPTGWLKEAAAEYARRAVAARLSGDRLDRARRAACELALSLGIASFHEMGGPAISTLDDATAWATGFWPVDVAVWWAVMDAEAGPGHGLRVGGDLFLDGSIGSATAAVMEPYRDTGGTGMLFHNDDAVAAFFIAATRAGRGAGIHVIGDRAIEQGLRAVEEAARVVGERQVRDCRHRFEHVELPRDDHAQRMAALGLVASVQPSFDRAWGGPHGLYARRFGRSAALRSNPLARFADAGVAMAFGSDSTVTPMDPWGAVAAAEHHLGGYGVDRMVAWWSHTLGGRHVAGQDDVGAIRVGYRADVAVWDVDPVTASDLGRISCLATLVRGRCSPTTGAQKSTQNS